MTINYPEHIHPIWQVDRRVFDVDEVTVLADNTCISCHDDVDDMDATMVPVAQLDLSSGASDQEADHFKSYRELLFTDNEQEIVGGILLDVLEDTGQVELNEDGIPIIDADGNTTPIFAAIPVAPTMNVAGALASSNFIDLFENGGSHDGYLSDVELKLISEWLDIGAQYWNNPFLSPEN